jgi:hypothetical protein
VIHFTYALKAKIALFRRGENSAFFETVQSMMNQGLLTDSRDSLRFRAMLDRPQVVSLDVARRLRAVGASQRSGVWYWIKEGDRYSLLTVPEIFHRIPVDDMWLAHSIGELVYLFKQYRNDDIVIDASWKSEDVADMLAIRFMESFVCG